jgi:5-methylthioadenosine/S-adenosylhomocysteine deaminase
MTTVYFARYILMPSGDIVSNGGVTIDGDTITSVGPRGALKRTSKDRVVNLGDVLLLPGLINLHTHLEESVSRGYEKDEQETFASWTAKKCSRVRSASAAEMSNTIRLAVREALANGITTIVDSSRTDRCCAILGEEPIRSWVGFEMHPESTEAEQSLETDLQKRIEGSGRTSRIAIGPHALYSLAPEAHKALIRTAAARQYLWLTHLAESAEELQAFTDLSGDLFFHITRRKSWPFAKAERGPMYYAITNNLIANNGICIHCTYVDGQELSLLAAKNVSIVLCFQYSQELGHKPFPLDVAFRRGINICLGTETPTTGRPMNLFDELYQLKTAYPHIPARDMLRWATQNPANALGCGGQLGSLEVGKKADIVGIRMPHDTQNDILEEAIREEVEIAFVLVDGEEIIIG